MRLWSIHPSLLDAAGLVAVWREALLAQKVLLGLTRGYRFHPQLERFRRAPQPSRAISTYLWAIHEEASIRGYQFNATKIAHRAGNVRIKVTRGQLLYEVAHLRRKLERRDPSRLLTLPGSRKVPPHPMFVVVAGSLEPWERITS